MNNDPTDLVDVCRSILLTPYAHKRPTYRVEIWADLPCPSVIIEGGKSHQVLSEVRHYMLMYRQDGPLTVKQTRGPKILQRIIGDLRGTPNG